MADGQRGRKGEGGRERMRQEGGREGVQERGKKEVGEVLYREKQAQEGFINPQLTVSIGCLVSVVNSLCRHGRLKALDQLFRASTLL